ncbi:hypothetical protein PHO31112_04769 [Pandoraea horticolens]|uniref:Uncharacterized protein n=1 Tax=Pandoraea horticolens TaxID=2508298 RepID=A0A5E4YUT9_9BURK|nr:hypothetical protein [Pandoraea horticolens]VVE52217.1 hypothetical protein PHO31112_04769 [Pandoraea horticolens]
MNLQLAVNSMLGRRQIRGSDSLEQAVARKLNFGHPTKVSNKTMQKLSERIRSASPDELRRTQNLLLDRGTGLSITMAARIASVHRAVVEETFARLSKAYDALGQHEQVQVALFGVGHTYGTRPLEGFLQTPKLMLPSDVIVRSPQQGDAEYGAVPHEQGNANSFPPPDPPRYDGLSFSTISANTGLSFRTLSTTSTSPAMSTFGDPEVGLAQRGAALGPVRPPPPSREPARFAGIGRKQVTLPRQPVPVAIPVPPAATLAIHGSETNAIHQLPTHSGDNTALAFDTVASQPHNRTFDPKIREMLAHPSVPEEVRIWASDTRVTEAVILIELQCNYPTVYASAASK